MRRGLKQMFNGNANGMDEGPPARRGPAPPPAQHQPHPETPPLQRPAGFLHKVLRSGGVTVDLDTQQQQQQQYPQRVQQQAQQQFHPQPQPRGRPLQQHQQQHPQPFPPPQAGTGLLLQQQQQQPMMMMRQSPRTASDLDSIEGDYAEINVQPWKRRETSAPMSPKTVKFHDEQQRAMFAFPMGQQPQQQQQQQNPYHPYHRSGSEQSRPQLMQQHQQQPPSLMSQSLYAQPEKFRAQQPTAMGRGGAFTAYAPPPHLSLQQQFAAAASRVGYDALGDRFTSPAGITTQQQQQQARMVPMAGGTGQHRRQPSAEEAAGAALDEATRDLLRLSAEPVSRFQQPMGGRHVQKAASTSAMQHSRFRLPHLFQGAQQADGREMSPETVSATAAAAARGRRPTAPFAGLSRPAPGQPLPQAALPLRIGAGGGGGGGGDGRPPAAGGEEDGESAMDGDEGPSHLLIHRHVQREHELETSEKNVLPPVVKTTVEGKLKMEKTVGSHLMRCDHQIAKAYTVRDTTTHYRIRTIIGKRQLLIEERTKVDAGDGRGPPTVRSTGTYRLSVYEDGKEVGTHEADIQLPEDIAKPDYLAKLSERLLSDLASLDDQQEQLTAVTRVEIECIEDVTDIVKTYLIGLAAPKEEEPVAMRLAVPADEFAYESASDQLDEGPIELESRVYIDQLEPALDELPPRDIHLLQEGRLFEDKTRIGIQPKAALEMSDDQESVESAPKPPPEALAQVDCELQRREDRSLMEVYIAVPLLQQLTVILRLHRAKRRRGTRELAAGYGYERQGQRFHDVTRLAKRSRFESEESLETVEPPPIVQMLPPRITVEEAVTTEQATLRQEMHEPMGGTYSYKLAGQLHEGHARLGAIGRKFSDESSVSSLGIAEPQPAMYSMESGGQLLEGEQKLRRMRHYESETSIDYEERAAGGGITHVTMVQKESRGHFELTIEIANNWGPGLPPLRAKERPEQRMEALEFMRTLERERQEYARCEASLRCANHWSTHFRTFAQQFAEVWLNTSMERARHLWERDSAAGIGRDWADKRSQGMLFNLRESSSEQAMLMCSLEGRGQQRQEVQTVRRTTLMMKPEPYYLTEFSSENVQLSLSIGASGREPSLQTEAKGRDARSEQLIHRCSQVSQESTSTMLYLRNEAPAEAPPVWLTMEERRESKGHQLRTIAQQMSQLTQHVHLERKEYENMQFSTETRPLRVPRMDMVRRQVREFLVENEHCAVLMENRGVSGEMTAADWAYSVTGV